MPHLWNDIRFGLRALTKSPGYTLVVIATLALAIGANTVIFSFANVLLLKPLPIRAPEGLAWIFWNDPHSQPRARSSFADYRDLRERTQTIESLAATTDDNVTLTGRGEAMRLYARRVTPNLFNVWGLQPVAGRLLRIGEDASGAACVVVLSDRIWNTLFQRDPSVVSTSVTIDGRACTIVGVVEPSIEIGNLTLIDVWMPVAADAPNERRDDRKYSLIGRLKPTATVEQAGVEMTAIAGRLQQEHPETNTGWTTNTMSTKRAIVGENAWLVFGMLFLVVGLVLLIACANVANLMLARATGRRRELAVRVALGAGRWEVAGQLVIESILLGIGAGIAGIVIAEAGLRIIRGASYEPFFAMVVIDRPVLWFALLLSLLTPLLFSAMPALHASSEACASGLREGGRTGGSIRARRSRNALIVAQVSLATMLLVVSGLVVRTMIALNRVDLGFDPRPMLTAQVDLPEWKFRNDADKARYYERMLAGIGRLPGVTAAGVITGLPSLSFGARVQFDIADRPAAQRSERPWAQRYATSDGYLPATGLVVVRGRWFASTDAAESARVAVISIECARRYWDTPDRAIGARIGLGDAGSAAWTEVVGVVGNTANPNIERSPDPYVYVPVVQQPPRGAALVVRTARPADFVPQLRAAVRDIDPDVPLYHVRPMQSAIADERSSELVLGAMFAAFAALALILATAGLYGVISFVVGQRTQEIGVRVALGAVPADIRRLVLRQGFAVVAIGGGIGLPVAAALASMLSSILFGVTALDPFTYGTVIAVVMISAGGAMWVPARRAVRLDPVRSLRAE